MGIAIKTLLEQEFFKDFYIVAGEKGLLKEVQGIAIMDAPDAYRWTKAVSYTHLDVYKRQVNQASLTGESAPVRRASGSFVYAGTVLEEGELTICVKQAGGSSRFEKIVTMIEESEKLKSVLEGKAEHLADKLVPYTLAGTALTHLFTRNITKMLSVLIDVYKRQDLSDCRFLPDDVDYNTE